VEVAVDLGELLEIAVVLAAAARLIFLVLAELALPVKAMLAEPVQRVGHSMRLVVAEALVL
jgi:hypothetical protein